MKRPESMKLEPEMLERQLESRLRSLLESIPGVGSGAKVWRNPGASDHGFDIMGELALQRTGNRVELWVVCKNQPRPSQFPFVNLHSRVLADGSRETRVPVLAAPYISPRMAQLCEEHGWSWFDLAGNCRLVVPGSIYIERHGLKPVHRRPKPKANLGTAASAQVLRALLAPLNVDREWTQTDLRKHCEPGVSIGLVNKVVRYLHDEAWVTDAGKGRFRVRDPEGLLMLWSEVYRFDRHRRLNFFTLLRRGALQERLERLDSAVGKAVLAAFSAADHQAPSVRQNKTWLFVNDAALDEFVRETEAKPVDSGENLVVFVPEDDGVFYLGDTESGGRLACTNPVQTWLDLRHLGGRGAEAAEAILERCLKPRWKGGANV